MFQTVVLVFALIALLGPTLTQTTSEATEEYWQKIFISRVRVMEDKHHIKFDPKWRPTLVFEIPSDIPPNLRMQFGAQYVPESQSFAVSPTEKGVMSTSLIDHELGHALVDQISRRAGNGMWPNTKTFADLTQNERVGINIISEGVGTYFEYQGLAPYPKDEDGGYAWLPEGSEDFAWRERDFLYNGGRWLVAPIIKQHGERGLLYLTTHKLRYQNARVRTAGQEYRSLALKQLAQ